MFGDNGVLTSTEMYRFNRLNNLQSNIKKQVTALGQNEETFLGKSLYQNFQDVSQKTIQYINKTQGLNVDWSYLDDKFITAAIKQNWQGGNFSSRLWRNKDKLLNNLNNNLVASIAAGKGINDIAADIKKIMGSSAYDSLRLARTETMHVLNNGQLTSFKNAGYSKVIWLTAEDEKVCDQCGPMDEKPFEIDNPPDCPLHANCRCTLAADPDSLGTNGNSDLLNNLDEEVENMSKSNDEDSDDGKPTPGNKISDDDLNEFINSLAELGINSNGFEEYCGDSKMLAEISEDLKILLSDIPQLANIKNGLILNYEDLGNTEDFALTKGKSIILNKSVYDDTEYIKSEYSKYADKGWFVKGTDYRSVIYHESGHVLNKNKSLLRKITALINSKAKDEGITSDEYVLKYISNYALAKDWSENYSELLSEVISGCYNCNIEETKKLCSSILNDLGLV
ncbi:hypothetical protein NL50_17185 [Clostridium acetobutylicum]|nr:hypothetical protein NL50_17185 [Clostridium acetobutylicum]